MHLSGRGLQARNGMSSENLLRPRRYTFHFDVKGTSSFIIQHISFPFRAWKWDPFCKQRRHLWEKGGKRTQTEVRKKLTSLSKMLSTENARMEKSEPNLLGKWRRGKPRSTGL